MNKIYKIIWSKVKNCYIVVSEIAKSHSKKSATKVFSYTAVAGILCSIVSMSFVAPVYARIYTAGGGVVDVAEGLRDHIVIGTGAHAINVINGVDDEKNNMIVIGDHMRANGEGSIAIGGTWQTDEWSSDDKVGAWGSNHILMGENSYTSGLNNVSLGAYNRSEGTNVVNIGTGSKSSGGFIINVGTNSESTGNYIVNVGTGARSLGNNSSVLGNSSVSFAEGGTAIGSDVGVYENATNSVAIGRDSNATEANVVSFGHRSGEIWAPSSEGNGNGITDSTYFDSDYFRRLINVADGTSASDVATVGQTIELVAGNGINVVADGVNSIGQKKYRLTANNGYTAGNHISIENGIIDTKNLLAYDTDANDIVTLSGTRGTKLTHLKQASLTQTSTDAVIGAQLYNTNKNIEGFARDIQANSNKITNLNTSVTNALSSVSSISTTVDVINDVKADASLNNLTDTGRQIIASAAANAVQEYMRNNNGNGNNGSTGNSLLDSSNILSASPRMLTLSANSNDNSTNNLNDDILVMNSDDLNNDNNNVINQAVQDALDTKVDISDFNDALELKADKDSVYSKDEIDIKFGKKADTLYVDEQLGLKADVSYVDNELSAKAGKDKVYSKEETNDLLEMKADKSALDTKANVDASNIDTEAWTTVLGTGKIEENDKGLVNGNTVYHALQDIKSNELMTADGNKIYIGNNAKYNEVNTIDVSNAKGENRIITGVITNPLDLSSVANVEYVNAVGDNIIAGVNNEFARMSNKISDVGANAAAMSALVPTTPDGNEKWALSAAVGHYDNSTAGAVGLFYKPSNKVIVNVKGTVGSDTNMLAGGVTVALDKGSTPGITKAQMVKTINEQANRIAQLEQVVSKLIQEKAQ